MKLFKDIPNKTEFIINGDVYHKAEYAASLDVTRTMVNCVNAYCITTRELVFIQGNEEVEVIEEGRL